MSMRCFELKFWFIIREKLNHVEIRKNFKLIYQIIIVLGNKGIIILLQI